MRNLIGACLVITFSLTLWCNLVRADLAPLVDRCPPATNAVVVIDSAQFMGGPLAKRLGWVTAPAGTPGAGAAAPRVDSPLPFVGLADGFVLAMQWDVGQMEPAWEFTVLSSN